MAREHHWLVQVAGLPSLASDDLTLDEVDLVEQVTGDSWVQLNPFRSVRHAKALMAVVAMRQGDDQEQALKRASTVTLGELKTTFVFVEGTAVADPGEVPADPPNSAPTSATG